MARPKQDRQRLNMSPLRKTVQQLRKLAYADNRSITSYIEVLIDKVYHEKCSGSAGEQPEPTATLKQVSGGAGE